MGYDDIKETIFEMIKDSSRTIIEAYLHHLSVNESVHYNLVVRDFNEYTYYMWSIEYKGE